MEFGSCIAFLSLFGLSAAQTLQQSLLTTNLSALDESGCSVVANLAAPYVLKKPYTGEIWVERTKPATTAQWHNAGIPNVPLTTELGSTIYCGHAERKGALDDFKATIPDLYCDGTEGPNGIQVQPVPVWTGYACQIPQDRAVSARRDCGCKSQWPYPHPSGVKVVQQGTEG